MAQIAMKQSGFGETKVFAIIIKGSRIPELKKHFLIF